MVACAGLLDGRDVVKMRKLDARDLGKGKVAGKNSPTLSPYPPSPPTPPLFFASIFYCTIALLSWSWEPETE